MAETKYFHRKYHRGQWHPGHRGFGGVERGSRKCFAVEVPDRRADTLEALILQHVLPGTHIVSDGWRAYGNLANIGNGIYTNSVINHSENFVDPVENDVHTQSIEGFWMYAKRKLRRQHGTSEVLFASYIHEFMWRWTTHETNAFSALIMSIWDDYAV